MSVFVDPCKWTSHWRHIAFVGHKEFWGEFIDLSLHSLFSHCRALYLHTSWSVWSCQGKLSIKNKHKNTLRMSIIRGKWASFSRHWNKHENHLFGLETFKHSLATVRQLIEREPKNAFFFYQVCHLPMRRKLNEMEMFLILSTSHEHKHHISVAHDTSLNLISWPPKVQPAIDKKCVHDGTQSSEILISFSFTTK